MVPENGDPKTGLLSKAWLLMKTQIQFVPLENKTNHGVNRTTDGSRLHVFPGL